MRPIFRNLLLGVLAILLAGAPIQAAAPPPASLTPITGEGPLPAGSDLGENALTEPREVFHSRVIGSDTSFLVKLGNTAFSAPSILGPVARQAGVSCETCHTSGGGNPVFFIPGRSSRPGTFNPTGGLFNPDAANGSHEALRIPGLRGVRSLSPYGHDGRDPSLRDFVHDVIVREFAGPEPAPVVLDSIVAYLQDIDFLPNPRLGVAGRLAPGASPAEVRGEALFRRPFPNDPALSCAGCHDPSSAFTDHKVHDVGTGGLERTPTLLNARFNAPYFHDGRYDGFGQVVGYFDRTFGLGLTTQDQGDMVAYLDAVGDGSHPYEPRNLADNLSELDDFEIVLDTAVGRHDSALTTIAADTLSGELREMVEAFPDRRNVSVREGKPERAAARGALKDLVLTLRELDDASAEGRPEDAAAALARYHEAKAGSLDLLMAAEPYSFYDRTNRAALLAATRAVQPTATQVSN